MQCPICVGVARLGLVALVALGAAPAAAQVPGATRPETALHPAKPFDSGVIPIFTFGLSTFTGKPAPEEPSDGSLFRPTQFDAGQWLESVEALGVRRVLVTAKQGDGFCLWESSVTSRCVRPGDGQPDVLDDLTRACRARGIECGVTFSWLDRSATTAERRKESQLAQLRELLTRYPNLAEIRLTDTTDADAAALDLTAIAALLAELQSGTELTIDRPEGGNRSLSLRPNWFWRQSENEHVRSTDALEEAWYESVANGSTLYLGVPPDNRGLVAAPDRDRLAELGARLRESFVDRHYAATRADGTDGRGRAIATFTFDAPRLINRLVVRSEVGGPTNITATIDAETDAGWVPLDAPVSLSSRRVLRFPALLARAVRVTSDPSGEMPLESLDASCAPPVVTIDAPAFASLDPTIVTLRCDLPEATIRYSLDGRPPTEESPQYTGPFTLDHAARVLAMATHEGRSGRLAAQTVTILDPNRFIDAVQFIRAPEPGLRMRRFDGDFPHLDELGPDFGGAPLAADSIVETIALPRDRPASSYGLIFQGFIEIPGDGIYTFSMRSDDCSRLFLHNTTVVDHGRGASWEWWQGRVPLRAGWHPIRVEFAQQVDEARLQVRWSGPGFAEQDIPAKRLSH